MISFSNLCKWFGPTPVLQGCGARVAVGEVVVVCGPSGSGKSTLIKCLNGLEPFQQGEVVINGITLQPGVLPPAHLRSKVGMVFQHFELFPHLKVLDNLCLAQQKVLGRSREEAEQKALALLQRVEMVGHAHKHPSQLSGGQQQRVAIARALAMDPVCMLFDEPTSALDPEMIQEVLSVMTELAQEGMTMMCVTHEMGFARRVAQRVLFMDQGRIVEDAPTQQFFAQPASPRAALFLERVLHH
ncbi:MAG: amino acid ABC transporter ATP-binding protein [Magnetococcales bacterium]|nr:amino acid ABC transporter ATP-binding protein [Magnetococcales bacterium]